MKAFYDSRCFKLLQNKRRPLQEYNWLHKTIAIVLAQQEREKEYLKFLQCSRRYHKNSSKKRFSIKEETKGVILEVKKDKGVNYLESILYDGELSNTDELVIPTFEGVVTTKIRNIQEALPLNKGFKVVEKVTAASGLRLQVISKERSSSRNAV